MPDIVSEANNNIIFADTNARHILKPMLAEPLKWAESVTLFSSAEHASAESLLILRILMLRLNQSGWRVRMVTQG